MTVLYWGTEEESFLDNICLKYKIQLIKSREKLKKIYRIVKPDLLIIEKKAGEKEIKKWIRRHGEERTFAVTATKRFPISEAQRFLKKIIGSEYRIPIAAVHPYTDALLFGYLISRKNNFEWIPENPYLLSSLPEQTKLRRCTVNNGEKTFAADFEFYSENGHFFLRSMIL